MGEKQQSFQLTPVPDKNHYTRILLYGLVTLFLIIIVGSIGFMFAKNNTQSQITPPTDTQNRPPPPPGITEVSPNPRSM